MKAPLFDRREFIAAAGCSTAALLSGGPRNLLASAPEIAVDLAHDPLRPEYHFLPPHNWMNDPNGPLWWKGQYHLFYQTNPGPVSGAKQWGHAVSEDMLHWRHRPIALTPTPGGPDGDGCWSGSAIVFDGVPTFLYAAVQSAPLEQSTIREGNPTLRETQMLATAEDDGLLRWKKLPNPVIAAPPTGLAVTGFRDPCPWHEADGWYLGVGSGIRGVGGCVLLYRSQDLRHWEYLHPLIQGKARTADSSNPVGSGEMWECPDFFPLGDRHCLLYSTEGKVYWTTGDYDARAHRYTPSRRGILDQGAYYAPKSFLAPGNRRILWGWITETRPEAEYVAAGWAGVMSLPRVLAVDADGQLTMAVADEVEKLRGKEERFRVKAGTPLRLELPTLRRELHLGATGSLHAVTLRLLTSGNKAWELNLDVRGGKVHCGEREFPLPKSRPGEPALRLFLDGSVIEAFVGCSQTITSRVYAVKSGQTELEIAVDGEGVLELTEWPLAAISSDRLTT
jgi:beta-fructofuranosidase